MGDMLTLIEKSQRVFDERQAKELASKIRTCGSRWRTSWTSCASSRWARCGPGQDDPRHGETTAARDIDDSELARVEAIIWSMTPGARRPAILNASRRRRHRSRQRPDGPRRQSVGQTVRGVAENDEVARLLEKGHAWPSRSGCAARARKNNRPIASSSPIAVPARRALSRDRRPLQSASRTCRTRARRGQGQTLARQRRATTSSVAAVFAEGACTSNRRSRAQSACTA